MVNIHLESLLVETFPLADEGVDEEEDEEGMGLAADADVVAALDSVDACESLLFESIEAGFVEETGTGGKMSCCCCCCLIVCVVLVAATELTFRPLTAADLALDKLLSELLDADMIIVVVEAVCDDVVREATCYLF